MRKRHSGKLAITNNLPFLVAAITRALAVNGGGVVPAKAILCAMASSAPLPDR